MQNPTSVTTQAFEGLVGEVAIELSVSDKRIYEILGRDNPYPKLWRLLTALGRIDADRLRLVQADFNARVDRICGPRESDISVSTVHRETSEAIQAIIDRLPKSERQAEVREAIASLQVFLED
jgi:hypothetical protein